MFLLHHLLTESSRKYPDKAVVVLEDKIITYSELETTSSRLSVTLIRHGVKQGDRVGIMLDKSIESIISLFGIMKAGASYVPLDAHAPISRNSHIIDHCGIEYLVTSPKNMDKLFADSQNQVPIQKIILTAAHLQEKTKSRKNIDFIAWSEIEKSKTELHCPVDQTGASPAYILHTSGSTGTPKGVVISHLNALTFVNMAVAFFKINEQDRLANHAPLHFDLSVFDIFCAIQAGATIVLVPEFLSTFPVKLAEYIDKKRITIWNSVATVLIMLADKGRLDRFDYDSLRLVHFSGDILPVKYLRILKNHMKNAEFYNIYGQTEANSSMYYHVKDIRDDNWKIPIGKPFPNFEVFLLDENGKTQNAPGHEGELYVKAATVALEYWQNEKETKEKFVTDPRDHNSISRCYKTGDIVRIGEEGSLIFVGRKDHMIKSRGYRIELAEIEATLNSHPLIRQAAVTAVPDELIGNKLIGHVSLVEHGELSNNDLYSFCSSFLPKYMIPEVFKFHDMLPTISTGKIDRKKLEIQSL